MRLESIFTQQNLKLAWRRINTGLNLQYKRYFREAYLVYEASVNQNISALHRKLASGSWEPSHATRIYLPKPSGLQRPLSLLELEDQIVLQAIANKFARKLKRKRKGVENRTVFSNILVDDINSIYITERWQKFYHEFQKKCEALYVAGYKWVGFFDLAAYYDTISHDLLISSAFKTIEPSASQFVRGCLQKWSANNIDSMTGHGIPQGPVASDVLGDGFFLPIDFSMRSSACQYIRYVDDIRLFGKSENAVRHAAIDLEQECRHRGLIPQSAKFEIQEIRSVSDAMGSMPSIRSNENNSSQDRLMSAERACRLLDSTVSGRPLRVVDKSRFRYVMYRAPADTRILNRALQMLARHPEHIDAFAAYFSNFSIRPRIARAALEVLESGMPYTYVRGELWHVVARLGERREYERGLSLARQDAKRRKRCVTLSWGVMHFLIQCDELGVASLGRRLQSEGSISLALLAPIMPDREIAPARGINRLLKGTLLEQLAGARVLQKRSRTLGSINVRRSALSVVCQNSLKALGVIARRRGVQEPDYLARHIASLYGSSVRPVLRGLMKGEYEHALQILVEAKSLYDTSPSDWLSLQDSFNDIFIRSVIEFLRKTGITGHQKLVGKDGKLVKFGSLISVHSPFSMCYVDDSQRFRRIHDRRNQLPGSHPYDEKGGARNRFLSRRERDTLRQVQLEIFNSLIPNLISKGLK